jgi:hypothetical protein
MKYIQLSHQYLSTTVLRLFVVAHRLRSCITPATDQTVAELIQAGGIHHVPRATKPFNSIWTKEEMPEQWKYIYYCTYLLEE